jgi:hypothetical protein
MRLKEPVILLGHDSHDRHGYMQRLWECFNLYGLMQGIALVNRRDSLFRYWGSEDEGLEIIEVDDFFNPHQIAREITNRISEAPVTHPFICVQDSITLLYLETLELLGYQVPNVWGRQMECPWIPVEAIRRGRLKPDARRSWNEAFVDSTQWALLRWNGKEYDWSPHGGLQQDAGAQFIVKPVAGDGSQLVKKVAGGAEAIVHAHAIQEYYASVKEKGSTTLLSSEGTTLSPYVDVLVEEFLEGPEYLVNGFIINGMVSCVVLHKETRFQDTFIGDGLLVCPPERSGKRRIGSVVGQQFEQSDAVLTSDEEFQVLLTRGLAAIGLDNWSFHAEVIDTPYGLRFVELNPRPAGGLVNMSDAYHLGIDPFEALVRLHLGIPTLPIERNLVTGELTIYATQVGQIVSVEGAEEVRKLSGVIKFEQRKQAGDQIEHAHVENVVAIALIRGTTHRELRELEWRIRRLIHIRYENDAGQA